MKITTLSTPAAEPKLFASVRGSRDLSLVAFATALLTAVALHLGAFLPRIDLPQSRSAAVELAAQPAPAPAAVAASQAPCAVPKS